MKNKEAINALERLINNIKKIEFNKPDSVNAWKADAIQIEERIFGNSSTQFKAIESFDLYQKYPTNKKDEKKTFKKRISSMVDTLNNQISYINEHGLKKENIDWEQLKNLSTSEWIALLLHQRIYVLFLVMGFLVFVFMMGYGVAKYESKISTSANKDKTSQVVKK